MLGECCEAALLVFFQESLILLPNSLFKNYLAKFPLSFFENMERIMSRDYIPNSNDVLRSRVRTTGITETQIRVENVAYKYVKKHVRKHVKT